MPFISIPNRSWFLTTLIMMSAAGLFATDIYLAALPQMAQHFNCTQTDIQASFTVFLLGLAGCQVIYGILADYFDRKRILLMGLSLFVLASILCAVADSLTQFIGFRLLQALGGGTGSVISRAIVSNLYSRTESVKIFATIFPMIGLSAAIAPFVGGHLTYFFDWRASFYFMALFGLVSMGLILAYIPKFSREVKSTANAATPAQVALTPAHTAVPEMTRPAKKFPASAWHSYFNILKNMQFLGYVLILCAGFAAFRCYSVESPFVFDSQGYVVEEISYFYIGVSIAYLAGNMIAKRLVNTYTVAEVIRFGFVFSVLGAGLMILGTFSASHSPYAIILPMSIVTFGNGFLFPTSSAAAMASVPNTVSGTASGVMGALQFVTAALSVHWVGQMCRGQAVYMSLYIGSIILVGLGCFLGIVYRAKEPETTGHTYRE